MADNANPPVDTDRISRQLGIVLSTTLDERITAREDPKPQEVERVLALPADKRYDVFVDEVLGNEEVWAVFDEKGMIYMTSDGRWVAPFWPQRRYAELCMPEDMGIDYVPIPLDDWIDVVITNDMQKNDVRPAIFPHPADECVVCLIDNLLHDLKHNWRRFLKAHLEEGEGYEACIERLERERMGAKPKGSLP